MNRYLFFLFVGLLGLSGCGSSTDDYVFTSSSVSARTTTLELRSVLAQTAVPSYVTTIRGSGFDASGERIYGPQNKTKAMTIQWTLVPVETTSFLFEFLGADGQVLGNATIPVQLKPDEIYTVDDLNVTFDPDPNPTPEAELTLVSNQSYQFNTDTGVISPPIGGSSNPSGWNNETKEFELQTFTLEAGAVLNVTGNTELTIKVQGDTLLDGTLNFTGADGSDGADTEASEATAPEILAQSVGTSITSPVTGAVGTNGAPGGVTIATLGQLSGSGAIFSKGGNGGNGGSVKISTNQTTISSTITGGRGGNGGASGQVKFIDKFGTVTIEYGGITVQTQAGNGGNGGQVEFVGSNIFAEQAVSIFGGRGGDGTGFGGSGGLGGSVLLSGRAGVVSGSTAGGAGGNGDFYGGSGGDVTFSGFNSVNRGTVSGGAGGSGGTMGGNGGSLNFSGQFTASEGISATGGAGGSSSGQGGYGGFVNFSGQWSANSRPAFGGAGGQGGSRGGPGGNINFSGQYGYNGTGAPATGGAGGNGGLVGGDGGHVVITNLNAGSATGGRGGNATQTGGDGGFVIYYPDTAIIPGATAQGGLGGSPSGTDGGVTQL